MPSLSFPIHCATAINPRLANPERHAHLYTPLDGVKIHRGVLYTIPACEGAAWTNLKVTVFKEMVEHPVEFCHVSLIVRSKFGIMPDIYLERRTIPLRTWISLSWPIPASHLDDQDLVLELEFTGDVPLDYVSMTMLAFDRLFPEDVHSHTFLNRDGRPSLIYRNHYFFVPTTQQPYEEASQEEVRIVHQRYSGSA